MEMMLLDAYDIPWKGLSNGCHDFDFEIDDRFFGEFGDSGIQGGRMKAEVRMEKSAAMLLLHVTIKGEVTVECSSSDRNVARVDDEGMVTGVGPGDATITITATDVNTGEYQTITVDVSVSGGGGYGTNDSASDEGEDRPSGGYGTSDERG